ncbi:MAG: GAF and ANTAR domain-containing protein [Pseudomonadota bacterium]
MKTLGTTPKKQAARPRKAPRVSHEEQIEALSQISAAITSDRYLDDILGLIVMVTAKLMNSKICSLWLLDDRDKMLRIRATQTISAEYLKERSLRLGEGVVGMVAQEDRPRMILDVREDPHFKEKELAQKEGLVSMLSVPMRVRDRVIGVINAYTSHPHTFTDTELNLFTAVANQAAVAIENTELMVKTHVIQEELAARKQIERAKDILVGRRGMTGEEAFRWIQRRSMDTRKSMREVADAIILSEGG